MNRCVCMYVYEMLASKYFYADDGKFYFFYSTSRKGHR